MVDIVLVYPPVTLTGRYGELASGNEAPPQPLIYLSAVLKRAGFTVEIIDANAMRWSSERTVNSIVAKSPRAVGITSPTMLISTASLISEEIKKRNKDIRTIVGGPHITAVPKETMEAYPDIDIGVIGEGEETIVELMGHLGGRGKKPLESINGLIYRHNGVLKITPKREYIKDLDTLPMPDWEALPSILSHYQHSVARIDRIPAISITTSRGCPYQCTFCARNVFGNTLRTHGADYIMRCIKYLKERYKIKSLSIEDENFVVFKRRLIELCRRMIDEKLNLTWSCCSSINEVNPEVLALMKKAGCWQISFGIESGSQRILDFIKKGTKIPNIENALKMTRDAGIMSKGYFMIGHLTETKETIKATIDFAKKIALDDFQMSFMAPLPGTEAYATAREYGTFDNDWSRLNIWTPVFIPNGLTRNDLERWSKRAFREFYFRPRPIMNFLKRACRPAYFRKYFKDGLRILKFLLKKD